MRTRRAPLFCALVVAAAAVARGQGPSAPAHRIYRPVAPEPEYYKLKHLMGDGMMPNYKALWSGFRRDDSVAVKQALGYIAALAHDSDRYAIPEAARADGGADFRTRMAGLAAQSEALSDQPPPGRDALSSRILSIYGTCQQCHDKYAPEEGKDRRKYSPPPA
jgi:hypothetical protein